MTTRSRLQNRNDSKSLWNYTLSPGWTQFDAHILRMAVIKYGCGAWRNIGRHFPLKNCNQLNLQTQRLFGQQALAEFNKVHVDPNEIKMVNDEIKGFRKNSCLINTGNNLRVAQREQKRQEHIAKYGVPLALCERIQIPVVLDVPQEPTLLVEEIEKLREMYRCIYDIELRVKHLQSNKGKNAANITVNANKKKVQKKNKKKVQNKNKNKNTKKSVPALEDNDVVMGDKNKNSKNGENKTEEIKMDAMDEDVAMAVALSASMASANINTPAIEKKSKKKRKSSKKKKKESKKKPRKRKTMDDSGDAAYIPKPAKKRVKTK